jgi:hypothetical protein
MHQRTATHRDAYAPTENNAKRQDLFQEAIKHDHASQPKPGARRDFN